MHWFFVLTDFLVSLVKVYQYSASVFSSLEFDWFELEFAIMSLKSPAVDPFSVVKSAGCYCLT